jgi:hypothetical protein
MLVSDETNSAVAAKGRAIYNDKLKSILEPGHNSEYVVIHVDSGDYTVSRRIAEATRAMIKRHGVDGRLLSMRIGPEPEYALAARLFASQMRERRLSV